MHCPGIPERFRVEIHKAGRIAVSGAPAVCIVVDFSAYNQIHITGP